MLWKLLIANLKMTVRNKQALFWALAFPLMFTLIFGFFFGKDSSSVGSVAWVNHSSSEIATQLENAFNDAKIANIEHFESDDAAREAVKNNKAVAAVIIPENFGVVAPVPAVVPTIPSTAPGVPPVVAPAPSSISLLTDPGQLQAATIVRSFLAAYLTQASFAIQHATPLFTVTEEKTTKNAISYFDFVLVGLIGLALMNSNIQGIAINMSRYREDKIIKRLLTTPLRAWQFILAEILSRLVVNVVQVSMILALGVFYFKAHIYGNLAIIYVLALLGALLFQALGFLVFAISKTTQAAEGMATAIAIPMMFLAGVFFPIEQLPNWLRAIVAYLPLAPLLRLLRQVGLESRSPFEQPWTLILVFIWIIVLLAISIKKFRLKDE